MIIIVATDEEYREAKKRWKHKIIIKTGVGGINIIKRLRKIPKWIPIINFGYAGSKTVPIGSEVSVGMCAKYHPNVQFREPIYKLRGEMLCYTVDDFIDPNEALKDTIYDMELAYICALGFKFIKTIKIISDECNQEQYNKYIKER